jgi:AraC-like DNA-binding protein
MSPMQMKIGSRMEEVAAQTALDCGLSDQPHFSNLVRRLVGMTPNLWRRPAPPPPFCSPAGVIL